VSDSLCNERANHEKRCMQTKRRILVRNEMNSGVAIGGFRQATAKLAVDLRQI